MKKIGFLLLGLVLITPFFSGAQEALNKTTFVSGRVVGITAERQETLFGTQAPFTVQTIQVEILDGGEVGRVVEFENDHIVVKEGEKIFLNHYKDIDGLESFSVRDIDRRGWMIGLFIIFILAIVLFAGKQGVRSLLSLVLSVLLIAYVLIPLILKGYDPLLVSVSLSALILSFAIFFTHGLNKESIVAFLGTIMSVGLTSILAYLAVTLMRFSGFASDESVYLNLNTGGIIDFKGLLLGAIIIGVLGVLDDIAITQASVVSELKSADKHMSAREVYRKAISVGKDHVGALVNTLALAYIGTSLPLLLLFANADASIVMNINSEVFATEVVRTLVGSIGLIITVPITTILAVYMIKEGRSHAHSGHSHVH